MSDRTSQPSSRREERPPRASRWRARWGAAALVTSVTIAAQACSVLLPWDDYAGPRDATPDATTSDATTSDGPFEASAPEEASLDGGPGPDGGLVALEVPCGPGLDCKNGRQCCAYADGRPWVCVITGCKADDAGAVLRCDSRTDCSQGYECCGAFTEAGTLDRTFCRQDGICAGGDVAACDPALGANACAGGSTCTRKADAGLAVTFCESR